MDLASILKWLYIKFVWRIFYEFDDVGEAIDYVMLCTFIPICYATRNARNSCVKSLHSHAIVSLVFMDFGFNLEVVLYQICMTYILWVGWYSDRNICFYTLYFHVPILYGSKSKKSIFDTFAFPCHWITSFHEFGFNLEGVFYTICLMDVIWAWWCFYNHIWCVTL